GGQCEKGQAGGAKAGAHRGVTPLVAGLQAGRSNGLPGESVNQKAGGRAFFPSMIVSSRPPSRKQDFRDFPLLHLSIHDCQQAVGAEQATQGETDLARNFSRSNAPLASSVSSAPAAPFASLSSTFFA